MYLMGLSENIADRSILSKDIIGMARKGGYYWTEKSGRCYNSILQDIIYNICRIVIKTTKLSAKKSKSALDILYNFGYSRMYDIGKHTTEH